jgi:hypothetical protein
MKYAQKRTAWNFTSWMGFCWWNTFRGELTTARDYMRTFREPVEWERNMVGYEDMYYYHTVGGMVVIL